MTEADLIKLVKNAGKVKATDLKGNETLFVIHQGKLRETSITDIFGSFYDSGTDSIVLDGTSMNYSIPHNLGALPNSGTLSFSDVSDPDIRAYSFTFTTTTIEITFTSAPSAGTNSAYYTVYK